MPILHEKRKLFVWEITLALQLTFSEVEAPDWLVMDGNNSTKAN